MYPILCKFLERLTCCKGNKRVLPFWTTLYISMYELKKAPHTDAFSLGRVAFRHGASGYYFDFRLVLFWMLRNWLAYDVIQSWFIV